MVKMGKAVDFPSSQSQRDQEWHQAQDLCSLLIWRGLFPWNT